MIAGVGGGADEGGVDGRKEISSLYRNDKVML